MTHSLGVHALLEKTYQQELTQGPVPGIYKVVEVEVFLPCISDIELEY